MTHITQDLIDAAYRNGKQDFRRWYGSHGPTLKVIVRERPVCPFTQILLREAWSRGFQQDARRLIAPRPGH